MNKKLLFAATVATMLASCSSDNLSVQTAARQEAQGLENAVSFEALSQRSLTRAGYAGAMDNAKLQEQGFGVFGYYTDLNEYDQTSTPNFMYNQKVSGAGWTYSPIKYWPNEYGNTAVSDDVDKLTFFAYAPYTENAPATGKVTEDQVGITGFTRATAAGDPYVKYVGSLDPLKCVDLCWGVADPNQNVTWNIIQGGSQTMTAGMPWMNVQRPQKSLGQKMKFFFKHALAQLNVQIDADVNTNKHGEGAEVDSKSKVYVRSITFNGFAMKGALNLNNEDANTPNWKGYNCNNEPIVTEEYTIYDGMKDGKEGTGYTASNEKVTGLNPTIIQNDVWTASAEGVTKTAKNLFNGAVDAPIYVIPTGDNMNVTIVYDIETKDDNLAGTVSDNETPGVSIENKISKTITLTSGDAMKLEAGKKYTIQLHLGLSQVEFDAEVEDWDDTAAAGEAWLPGNGAGDVYTTNISLDQTSLNMTVGDADVTLDPTVEPATATDQTVSWISSDETVATVDANGKVHAVGAGTATITATASGGQTATCTVTVTSSDPTTLSALKTWVNYGHASDNTYLGYFVKADGSISTDNTDAIGIVAYYGNAAVDESAADSRILVLATADASGSAQWKTSYTGGESAYNDPDALNGIAFTNAYGDNSAYLAAQAAKGYSAGKPTGASIWFLPSKGQWTKMIDAGHTGITSGGYWSSTESAGGDTYAWDYYFGNSSWNVYGKGRNLLVRAAFAY